MRGMSVIYIIPYMRAHERSPASSESVAGEHGARSGGKAPGSARFVPIACRRACGSERVFGEWACACIAAAAAACGGVRMWSH